MGLAASLAVLLALSTASLARAQSSIASGVKIEPKGEEKSNGSCTAGPMAIPKDEKDKTYLLTAGHCIAHGGGVGKWWVSGGKVIGPAEKVVFGVKGDFGAILIAPPQKFHITNEHGQPEVVEGEWQTGNPNDPVLARIEKGGVSWPVAGETKSSANLKSCHVGVTSGYRCGQVIGTGATYPEEGTLPTGVGGLVEDTALGEPGDSGGPWFVEAANPPLSILGVNIAGHDPTLELKGSIANGANVITGITPGWVITGIENRLKAQPKLDGTVTSPGNGIPANTTVVKVNSPTEVEISNKATEAEANVEFTFTYPPVSYYEPIETILNEWGLELLTTNNEKRKVKPELVLRTAVGLVGDGSIWGGISSLVFYRTLGNLECPSGMLKGELTANEGTKEDTGSFSEFSSCPGIESGDFPWPIEFKKNGEAAIKGTNEMLVAAGECQFASKKVKGAFTPGKAGEPIPLELRISEQKFKLKSKSKENKAKCGKEAKLSGTLTFTSQGETVEDEVT